MAVTIKTNRSAWKAATDKAADFAAAALAEQMRNDSIDYIPKAEGNLRDGGQPEKMADGEYDLVWRGVYAGYQWFGARADGTHEVKHYTTPGTGKAWVDEAKAANKEKWDQTAQNGFTEGMR